MTKLTGPILDPAGREPAVRQPLNEPGRVRLQRACSRPRPLQPVHRCPPTESETKTAITIHANANAADRDRHARRIGGGARPRTPTRHHARVGRIARHQLTSNPHVSRTATTTRRAITSGSEAVSTRDAPPPAPDPTALHCPSRPATPSIIRSASRPKAHRSRHILRHVT